MNGTNLREVPEKTARLKAGKNLVEKTPSEWTTEHVMRVSSNHRHLCACFLELADACLSLPVSNAWRGASVIKKLKTSLRSSLKDA